MALEIIPTSEEARLAVISCSPLIDEEADQILVIDIGGGSTELIWINLTKVKPSLRRKALSAIKPNLKGVHDEFGAEVIDWISVPLGVATLKDQFKDVEGDLAQFALMACHFEENLYSFLPYQNLLDQPTQKFQMIGTSGTITTIASSFLKLEKYDRNKVDGLELSASQIEDVINRGGGLLGVELFNSKEDGTPDDSSNIILSKDGEKVEFSPGEHFYLKPGESITLVPGVYHKFWGSNEKVLVGEVSLANDDVNDNVFVEEVGRFPDIEEDEEPYHLLITDYDSFI